MCSISFTESIKVVFCAPPPKSAARGGPPHLSPLATPLYEVPTKNNNINYTEQQGFVNCATICGLNQFWDAESKSEVRFSLLHRIFE